MAMGSSLEAAGAGDWAAAVLVEAGNWKRCAKLGFKYIGKKSPPDERT